VGDVTGEYCDVDQPDDVWFLAGTFGETGVERKCTVPAGRPVYLPGVNTICPIARSESVEDVVDDCKLRRARVSVKLDGRVVETAEATSGDRFRLDPGDDDVLDLGGPTDAVAWGIWAGPLDLAPGRHTLSISARATEFTLGVTYALTVR
jgi:hypothetical protein